MDARRSFLQLLASAVHDLPVPPVPPECWPEVLALADEHNLYPLVCEQLCSVPGFAQSPLYEPSLRRTMGQLALQMRLTDAFLEVYRTLDAAGCHPMVMKGLLCRQAYGRWGEHRPSGDEDLLVPADELEKACGLLTAQGWRTDPAVLTQPTDMLHHAVLVHPQGLTIELHVNPIGVDTPGRMLMNSCFRDVSRRAFTMVVEDVPLRTMTPTDHFLLLVMHAAKHLSGSGAGIRHLLDVAVWGQRYDREIDWTLACQTLAECHALQFYADLAQIANAQLGFQLATPCPPLQAEQLLDELMLNGIFSNETPAQRISGVMAHAAAAERTNSGAAAAFHALFPSRTRLQAAYPELNERPWKWPFYWVRRWKKAIAGCVSAGPAQVLSGISHGKQRMALLKRYDMM